MNTAYFCTALCDTKADKATLSVGGAKVGHDLVMNCLVT
jgi:hypothetical protein